MKRVLVTGSTQGIGYAIAKTLVGEGYEVIVHCSSDQKKAESVRAEIGAAQAVTADLSDRTQTENLYKKTGDVDCLILNASVQYKEFWQEITAEHFDMQVNVNFYSTLKLMQLYYPYMKKNGFGRIVTIGSVNQHRRHKELSLYASTKCAVMSLVENVAKYSAPYGVTVNNVSPGAILTPRNQAVYDDENARKTVESQIPVGRFGKPEEVAGLVALLLSEKGAYITGSDLSVDGGMKL